MVRMAAKGQKALLGSAFLAAVFASGCGGDGGDKNRVPAANDQSVATPLDASVAVTLTASDPDGDALVWTVDTQPAHGTLTGVAPDLTYAPDAGYHGMDSFTFHVNDGAADSNVATVSIAVNDAPAADSQAVSTVEETPLDITLTASDANGDALTWSIDSGPADGSLGGVAPDLTYTPAVDFFGQDSFTFHVNDGYTNSNIATVTVDVTNVNDAPVAQDQSVGTGTDTATNIVLVATDADGDALLWIVDSPPANGTLSGTAPALNYTPDGGYHGVDTFTFHANDAVLDSNVATVSIAVNDPPVADDLSTATPQNTALSLTLTASDPNGDALTWTVDSPPVHGVLTGTAPALTYTPDAGYLGFDGFTFHVNDGYSDSNTATVIISVTRIWYVDLDAAGPTHDGASWATAFLHPQDALDAAVAGEEVWVAEGAYVRRGVGDRVLLTMADGVAIYGGFAGTESARDQRDPVTYATVLDGEDYCYHVVAGASGATLDGFAITRGYASGSPPDGSGAGMYNDSVATLTVANCSFVSNSASDDGGAIYNLGGSVQVANCTFTANSAALYGGAVYNEGGSPGMSGCDFDGNSAEYRGGGVYNLGCPAEVEYCTFSANSVTAFMFGEGGGVYNDGGAPTFTYCDFDANSSQDMGGAMFSFQSTPEIVECTFTGNLADRCGGMYNRESSAVVTNCTFDSNDGPAMINMTNSTAVVTDCIFVGNSTGDEGAGMYNYNSSALVVSCEFTNNSAFGSGSRGGGMCNVNSSPTVTDCTFTGNTALNSFGDGGGIYNANSSPTVDNCTFDGNSVDGDGGGMYNGDGSPEISNCTFVGNSANMDGGAVYNDASSLTATDCVFRDSFPWCAMKSFNSGGYGQILLRCDFVDNVGGGLVTQYGWVTATDCTFTGNSTPGMGGGMFSQWATPQAVNCTFTGNSANWGGGMYNSSSSPTVTDCAFAGNLAAETGGGMHNYNSSPSLANCVLSGNWAGDVGGGMYNDGSSPTMTNCSLTGNLADSQGGAMCGDGSTSVTVVTNCILWGDFAPADPEISHMWGSSATVTYSDVQSGHAGAGNIDADPLFIDPGYWDDNGTPADPSDDFWVDGDYHLQTGSLCIDAADGDAAPALDKDGNPRVDDSATANTGVGAIDYADMGAYEYQGP